MNNQIVNIDYENIKNLRISAVSAFERKLEVVDDFG